MIQNPRMKERFEKLKGVWPNLVPWERPADNLLRDRLRALASEQAGREAAVTGLDWLGLLLEDTPDLVDGCRPNADLVLAIEQIIEKAELPENRNLLGNLKSRARFRRAAAGKPDKSSRDLAQWLLSAPTYRMLFPVYDMNSEESWLCWIEVTVGPRTNGFQEGWQLADWTFHVPTEKDWESQRKDLPAVPSGDAFLVSFQPLRHTDFDLGDPSQAWAAASLLTAPLDSIGGRSWGLPLALAAKAAEKRRALRPGIATGGVYKNKIGSIGGRKNKALAVRTFKDLKGRARFFVFPDWDKSEISPTFDGDQRELRIESYNEIDAVPHDLVLSDGFDDYREFRVHQPGFTPGTGAVDSLFPPVEDPFASLLFRLRVKTHLKSLLRPTVPQFNGDPEPVAVSIFNAIETALLSPLARAAQPAQRWEALSRLPDDYVVLLCKLTDLEKNPGQSLEWKLANLVVADMAKKRVPGQNLDPPTDKHFAQKKRDGKLALVVYPEASHKFLMRAETEKQLLELKELADKYENRVILVCPDAHLRWRYDRLKPGSEGPPE